MNKLDDKALVKRALKGDRTAFSELLSRHYDYMFKIAFKWTHNQNDAEDITENVCIKLVSSLKQFRGDSAFSTWLYPIVINAAKDHFKKQSRHKSPQRISSPNEHKADERVMAQQVLDRISELPEDEREALVLVSFKGLSHKAAAELLDCAESTVSWRIHEARKKISEGLNSGESDG